MTNEEKLTRLILNILGEDWLRITVDRHRDKLYITRYEVGDEWNIRVFYFPKQGHNREVWVAFPKNDMDDWDMDDTLILHDDYFDQFDKILDAFEEYGLKHLLEGLR